MLAKGKSIVSRHQVMLAVNAEHQLEISKVNVGNILKKELGLGYRTAGKVPMQANLERCLVLRQQYALAMLPLLKSGHRIINVVETWLNESNFTLKKHFQKRCRFPRENRHRKHAKVRRMPFFP